MDSASAYFAMPAFPRGPWQREYTVALSAVPSAVSIARRQVRETLWEWKLDRLADEAEIIVSELVTNAIQHASHLVASVTGEVGEGARTVLVRLLGGPSRLLILVWDAALAPPVIAETGPSADDESGRGLRLVSALATCWHWYHPSGRHGGKVVWALCALEGQDMETCTCGFRAAEPDGLFDHLEETFAAPDDRDTDGVAHAEAAREAVGSMLPHRCLCGHVTGDAVGLDAHLLAIFTPADQVGQDGRTHAPVGHDRD
jgi:anti-sigma regulatory factor (Ser/Thr protein kinase)